MPRTLFRSFFFFLVASVVATGDVTSEKADLDFSIKFGMTSGSVTQAASDLAGTTSAEIPITKYGGNPLVIAWNNDIGAKITLSGEISLVMDFKNKILAEKGIYASLAYHLLGGTRKTTEDLGFARFTRKNPYNFSLIARVGYTLFEAAVTTSEDTQLVKGATFETMFGVQFRQDIGDKSSIALEYLMDMLTFPATTPQVTCKRTAILLSYRFFL